MMPDRKYGFWNVETEKYEGVGMRAMTEFESFKSWCCKEFDDLKDEIRALRRKIDEVESQVV